MHCTLAAAVLLCQPDVAHLLRWCTDVPLCTACTACTACRERNDGLYRVITYLVAKMVEELGIALLNSIIFGGCCMQAAGSV